MDALSCTQAPRNHATLANNAFNNKAGTSTRVSRSMHVTPNNQIKISFPPDGEQKHSFLRGIATAPKSQHHVDNSRGGGPPHLRVGLTIFDLSTQSMDSFEVIAPSSVTTVQPSGQVPLEVPADNEHNGHLGLSYCVVA
ncbi:hypothetical protein FA95DRAFT_1578309 [Auriscalpium vulgare]|uniref:Uncharacterized protein n=1 Tax=Auriscalpium vulgare TaxID=40419 RepID=A0ACB8R2C8_9AGAM|nr:hypothetical protein FA95DRAFT_1578309 [Auriscalpium vulgare]